VGEEADAGPTRRIYAEQMFPYFFVFSEKFPFRQTGLGSQATRL
jgi:hypothetical protein